MSVGVTFRSIYMIKKYSFKVYAEAVMAVIVWSLDLQLHMQSVPITVDGVVSTSAHGEEYNIT